MIKVKTRIRTGPYDWWLCRGVRGSEKVPAQCHLMAVQIHLEGLGCTQQSWTGIEHHCKQVHAHTRSRARALYASAMMKDLN